ncbi:MAG: dephospho-CoA kinase [Phycisphaerae bacterium]|nr:dephospho-CoA kinase [Phycisphaerae bacterium]
MSARHKPIIGICGGIGAGKSTVARVFAELGCLVIDSDAQSHEVLGRPEVVAQLREWWGREALTEAGEPRRDWIARRIFADESERRRLESLLHPLIVREHHAIITRSKSDPAVKAIILDSPLLLESNLDGLCDKIVYVHVSEEQRRQRLRSARKWDPGELERREQCQWPLERKRGRSDFVISNEGSADQLRGQVADILEEVLA